MHVFEIYTFAHTVCMYISPGLLVCTSQSVILSALPKQSIIYSSTILTSVYSSGTL
uniref:Uncharacterized protein n=1 Tax=Anguilla anguilla TaxID=7936 RepID=A0A0E9TMT4_ANGAN